MAVGAGFLLRSIYIDSVTAIGGGAPVWLPLAAGLVLSLITTGVNLYAIRRRVLSAF